MPDGSYASERLRQYVERLERLEQDKKEIAAQIREVKAEAKSAGFDVRTIAAVIQLRKMSPAELREYDAVMQTYRGALGMLYDTPLGEAARRRLDPRWNPDADPDQDPDQTGLEDRLPRKEAPEPPPDVTEDDARHLGADAAKAGVAVTENPFAANSRLRAAWDEGWCSATGSDGMDIPEAWRRSKPKKPKGEPDDEPQDDQPEGDDAPDDDQSDAAGGDDDDPPGGDPPGGAPGDDP